MRRMLITLILLIITFVGISGFQQQNLKASPKIELQSQIPIYKYRIINTYPHDQVAFTQGLIYYNGELYEGKGLERQSSLRRVELKTGKVLQSKNLKEQCFLNQRCFGEGITLWQDQIIQ